MTPHYWLVDNDVRLRPKAVPPRRIPEEPTSPAASTTEIDARYCPPNLLSSEPARQRL